MEANGKNPQTGIGTRDSRHPEIGRVRALRFRVLLLLVLAGALTLSVAAFTRGALAAVRHPDYDGDGKADIAVYRGSTGEWFILRSSDGGLTRVTWGAPALGDVPVEAATSISFAPPVRGVYALSSTITQTGCLDPDDNGTFGISGTLNISTQTGGIFAGTATLSSVVAPGIALQDAIMLFGTVDPQGQLRGSLTFTVTVNGIFISSGDGTFNGSISGKTLSAAIAAQERVGDTCRITGTLTGTK